MHFASRVILPFRYNNKIVGYTARWCPENRPEAMPKYYLQQQKDFVFNLDAQKKHETVIVTEGQLDAIQVGGVALAGNSPSNNQCTIIEELEKYDFSKAKFTIFAAGSEIAKTWAPSAAKKTIVIDNSKYFRMNDEVPLVVAEVNPNDLKNHKNIISNPNCSTIQLMLPLKPLHDKYRIKRVIVSTYQAVSGAGKASVDELFSQTKDYLNEKEIVSKNFSKQMAFNLIPHIDVFVEDGYTKEEWKMENETKKFLINPLVYLQLV